MDRAELKQEIIKIFESSSKPLYFSDLAEALNADLKMVVDVCKELVAEGKIVI